MSEIVKELTFDRFRKLVVEAGDEGIPVCSVQDAPTCLTRGRTYKVKFNGNNLYFQDDSDIPVPLWDQNCLSRFEPIVDAAELLAQITDQRSMVEHRVHALLEELAKIPVEETTIKPNDIVVRCDSTDGMDSRPYIVAKILTRDEMRLVGQVVETLVAHDLLVFHNHGGPTVSILSSHKVERIGSLVEWDLEPLDPRLVERLTVFDAVKESTS